MILEVDTMTLNLDLHHNSVTYQWSTNFGSVSGATATAIYQAPSEYCCPTTATVSVLVDDGRGGATPATTTVQVSP
jgi:hypothetical protein